jgi:dTDP-4-dehydrorhamnose 3,5-epimerase
MGGQNISGVAPDPTNLPRSGIQVCETGIKGCYELRPAVVNDQRGYFAKIFHRPLWEELGLSTDFAEEYLTYSVPGVLRGLHFQIPPMHCHKVVLCLQGRVWDAAVDLRKDSPSFGQHVAVELSGAKANAIYLPAGLAHGFCVTGTEALLYYKVSSVYSPEHDAGIRWDSANVSWPISDPVLSDRDLKLPSFAEFDSPFTLVSNK